MGFINKAIKFVFDRNYRFLTLDYRGVYNSMDDKEYLERKYESIFNIKSSCNLFISHINYNI